MACCAEEEINTRIIRASGCSPLQKKHICFMEDTNNPRQTRRTFLGWLLGLGTVAVGTTLSVPLIRFALHPLTGAATETEWADLGGADELASITAPKKIVITVNQVDGWRKVVLEKSVYVTKGSDDKLKVLTSVCPHLGCSVRYNDADKTFACPCHKGSFSSDGKLISGPPPSQSR